jgi:hypothetical protein
MGRTGRVLGGIGVGLLVGLFLSAYGVLAVLAVRLAFASPLFSRVLSDVGPGRAQAALVIVVTFWGSVFAWIISYVASMVASHRLSGWILVGAASAGVSGLLANPSLVPSVLAVAAAGAVAGILGERFGLTMAR